MRSWRRDVTTHDAGQVLPLLVALLAVVVLAMGLVGLQVRHELSQSRAATAADAVALAAVALDGDAATRVAAANGATVAHLDSGADTTKRSVTVTVTVEHGRADATASAEADVFARPAGVSPAVVAGLVEASRSGELIVLDLVGSGPLADAVMVPLWTGELPEMQRWMCDRRVSHLICRPPLGVGR